MRTKIFLLGASMVIFLSSFVHAQTVKGIVSDENNLVLPGATVLADGGAKGISTDMNGAYSLTLSAGEHTLEFTFIGYQKQSKKVNLAAGQTLELNISMKPDAVFIDDVVVVGYGVQRKKDVTGNIATVDSKALTALPTPSFEAALQGQAAGVQVTQGSGLAGSASTIRVRGTASVSAGGDPLYVVDGIPITQDYFIRGNGGAMNNNPLATLNPNDIESVEILKDASATAIYGSRGANGVILITTKRGAKKKGLTIDFTSRVGISTPATLPNMTNTEEYLQLRQEAWENDGGTGYVWLPNYTTADDDAETRALAYKEAMTRDIDWVDRTIGTGVKQMYSVGIRKGGEKYGLYAGLSYDDNQSYLLGNGYERISGRINFDYTVNKWLKAMVSTSLSRGVNSRIDAAWSGGLGDAMSNALPFYPERYEDAVFDADGNILHPADEYFIWRDEFGGAKNPVGYRESFKSWRNIENRSVNNLRLIMNPVKNLNIVASGGFDWMFLREEIDEEPIPTVRDFSQSFLNVNYILNWNYSLTANYDWDLLEDHKFGFLAGTEFQRSDSYGYSEEVTAEVPTPQRNGNPSQFSFLSYFGRANYTYKDRYLVQATARVDGSSRFGRNNRYGFFPSVSAGWIVSEEDFLKDSKNISFLKVKASWGLTGNANIPDYARFGTYSAADNGILYGNEAILFPLQLANPNLQWETSRVIDASVEMGLWKDRVTFELGVYNKMSNDVLMNVNVSPSTGFTNYWDNVAQILNRGVEFSIKSRNIVGKFEWTTDFNIARNYNELVDIGNYTPDAVSGGTNDSRVIVGKPIGSFYLVEFSHVDQANGLPVYLDLNGNETYDYDNAIRKYVGDGLPDFIGGMTNSFRYKNWDLQALAIFSVGAKIFDSSAKRQLGVVSSWNMRTDKFDRWRQPGDVAEFPILTLDETKYGLDEGFPWWNTSLFVYDASYLRLRNLALGYTFQNLKVKNMTFNNLRLAVNVTNLFTLTNFPGLDPEVARDFENAQDRNLSPNVTYLTPPQERSYNFTLSFAF
ncbi:MAG: TonB-dependent receptor [Flavobacteriales bacterium]|nr:TonB-dependent receptor [Flavobacteriales bacterium]MDG1765875.1 TonB-dependent receptor [Flavobacteriales bacterium]